MTTCIVKVITLGGNALYYTGKAGAGWLSESAAEAFDYSEQAAGLRAESFARTYAVCGLRFEVVARPNDLYFSLLDNCGDEIAGRQVRGGQTEAMRRQIAADMVARNKSRRGVGCVLVRDAKTWILTEKMELPA